MTNSETVCRCQPKVFRLLKVAVDDVSLKLHAPITSWAETPYEVYGHTGDCPLADELYNGRVRLQ